MKNKRGWVPAAYLEPLDSPDESEEQEPNYAGKKKKLYAPLFNNIKDKVGKSDFWFISLSVGYKANLTGCY